MWIYYWIIYKRFRIIKKKYSIFFCGVGRLINNKNRGSIIYIITKPLELNNIIIPHFNKYPLLTKKWADFELFKLAVKYIINNDHLTN